ncbi:xanthine dehydrogenase family protein molybdopterin-binding subunit [Candidatus Uabimicrobium amorphum]|uniref:Carbon-monoxide dehydrogenase large subunit n=1 Tax=Uabimicrobium amorphum TaxID=2596890 RepID=A0A5S9F3B2_UABAM|nr:xanthine dehydrogenase family protein molybdopterin-binding subunit [Candidatus Uabimicrobium amorphum]BBM84547.1 carbon-monoxide dehydrogenase large subunit [Candidatus Uabimicrobium amorphum]
MAKEVKLHIGVENDLEEIKVTIPDDSPKPWDGKDKLKFVGGKTPRLDGKEKVTGNAKYTFDMKLSGTLHAKFFRLPCPSAVVTKIDTSAAEKAPGVKGIVLVQETLPLTVRYADQELLAIAAETAHQVDEALKLVKVEYEKRPFVVDLAGAQKSDAPEVFQGKFERDKEVGQIEVDEDNAGQRRGNVRAPQDYTKGGTKEEIEQFIEKSEFSVSATYQTQVQTHSALETHGVVANWEGDHLTVWASTQGTFSVLGELAQVLKIPQTNVRVITDYMGGGFGAKFGAGPFGIAAAKLAKKTGRPVKLMFSRREEHVSGGNRPSSMQTLKIATNKSGKLEALSLVSRGSAGISTGAGTSAPAKGIYECPKIYTQDADVFTNAGPSKAFRAPGHPQGIFALEQSIDDLAYKIGMDPLEFRKINTMNHDVRQKEYQIGAEKFAWHKRNPKVNADKGPIKTGMGMANSVWYYFYGVGYQATIKVNGDGSVELLNGTQDIGTGSRTAMAVVAAEELGLKPHDIVVRIGDTKLGFGPPSGGSQTTAGITPAVRDAAYLAKNKMLEIAATHLNATAQELDIRDGVIFVTSDPTRKLSWKKVASKIPGGTFSVMGERKKDHIDIKGAPAVHFLGRNFYTIGGMQFAEVEVDTETGVIKVKRILAIHDCGRPINRLTLQSQLNGGIIQGVSYALFEQRVIDRNHGLQVNPNLEQYKIAGSMDIPEIETIVLDTNRGNSSTGAQGIGEPATAPVAAAIANAVYHAIGVRIRDLPMTPAKVLEALHS